MFCHLLRAAISRPSLEEKSHARASGGVSPIGLCFFDHKAGACDIGLSSSVGVKDRGPACCAGRLRREFFPLF
jgi:hypothetical protein